MTNKLPVVGKKYKHKEILEVSFLEEQRDGRTKVYFKKGTWVYANDIEYLLEELPEDKTEIRKENPPVISELSEEVKQAMEKNKKENKEFLENVGMVELYLMSLDNNKAVEIGEALLKTIKIKIQQSQDLVDALNKQFGGEND